MKKHCQWLVHFFSSNFLRARACALPLGLSIHKYENCLGVVTSSLVWEGELGEQATSWKCPVHDLLRGPHSLSMLEKIMWFIYMCPNY